MKITEGPTRLGAKARRRNKARGDETKTALRRVADRPRAPNSIEKLYRRSLSLTSSSLSEAHETRRNKAKAKIRRRDEGSRFLFKG